jgi:hypothetical protein
MRNCTHLTVNWGRDIEIDQVKDYGHEGGEARNGVNLSRGLIRLEPLGETQKKYPYCPSIWMVSSDDIPLILETGDELPAGSQK